LGMICALANQKGGVGKTTTAVNLGAALAEYGQRVLLIDADPQANATSALGLERRSISLYDVLVGDTRPDRVIIDTIQPGLQVLPSSVALAGAEVELVSMMSRETVLRRRIEPLRPSFDTILIDCPPSLGLLTLNGLTASDAVIIPVQCEYLALEGLQRLIETIILIQSELNTRLQILGLLLTMYDSRTKLAQQVVDDVRKYFEERVFETIVPRSVRLAEAPSYGKSILEYASYSAGAAAYRSLAREVVERQAALEKGGR
jgi:chromosome partitioning protein